MGPWRSFQGRKPGCWPAGKWVPAARSGENSRQRWHTLQVNGYPFDQERSGQLFCCESCHHLLFFPFSYSGSIHLDFPLLWFSLCFHNLSTPGWSGFRQAAASAGSHRVHVLMEEMRPQPMSPHPRKGSDSYTRWGNVWLVSVRMILVTRNRKPNSNSRK